MRRIPACGEDNFDGSDSPYRFATTTQFAFITLPISVASLILGFGLRIMEVTVDKKGDQKSSAKVAPDSVVDPTVTPVA